MRKRRLWTPNSPKEVGSLQQPEHLGFFTTAGLESFGGIFCIRSVDLTGSFNLATLGSLLTHAQPSLMGGSSVQNQDLRVRVRPIVARLNLLLLYILWYGCPGLSFYNGGQS